MDPKPFLEYLDKEMTIMGLLSVFSLALASLATERIATATKGFLYDVWLMGGHHVIAGAAMAVVAALLFYLQRSHLAWYYGQIALAQVRGATSPRQIADWLTYADGWDTWIRYQVGFIALTVSITCYVYAVAETLNQSLSAFSKVWSLWLPLCLMLIVATIRWYLLTTFPQEDQPVNAWWHALRTGHSLTNRSTRPRPRSGLE